MLSFKRYHVKTGKTKNEIPNVNRRALQIDSRAMVA
jgi:hypothetical protein